MFRTTYAEMQWKYRQRNHVVQFFDLCFVAFQCRQGSSIFFSVFEAPKKSFDLFSRIVDFIRGYNKH